MGIKTVPQPPYSPDVSPCDFWLFPKLRGWRCETIEEMKGCDDSHWHPHTRRLLWGLPDVVGTVQQVHCSRRRLLQRGLEFHVCTINKSTHTKKVWKLILCSSYQKNTCGHRAKILCLLVQWICNIPYFLPKYSRKYIIIYIYKKYLILFSIINIWYYHK